MKSVAFSSIVQKKLKSFFDGKQGSIAALAGVMIPLLLGGTLFGIDHMRAANQIARLQDAADAAAISSAREMSFVLVDAQESQETGSESEVLTAIASGMVDTRLQGAYPDVTTSAILLTETSVKVVLTASYESLFGEMGFFGENPFSVDATAETFGSENICLIAVGPDQSVPAIDMEGDAHLNGENCGIYSGATAVNAIALQGTARISSTLVCSGGGFEGNENNVSVDVITDCTQVKDPLRTRRQPRGNGGCDHTDLTLDGGSHTLDPGVYCGKTDIKGGADVWMNPGIYVFRDGGADGKGELFTRDTSRLQGNRVGLHFKDLKSQFRFLDDSEINLSAPITGDMAGLLISSVLWCDDGITDYTNTIVCPSNKIHEIRSSNVKALLGTIHLAWDELLVDTTMPVSSEAAFTIIVIGKLTLKDSPTLVLNTDYAATTVPVPAGFESAITSETRLVD